LELRTEQACWEGTARITHGSAQVQPRYDTLKYVALPLLKTSAAADIYSLISLEHPWDLC